MNTTPFIKDLIGKTLQGGLGYQVNIKFENYLMEGSNTLLEYLNEDTKYFLYINPTEFVRSDYISEVWNHLTINMNETDTAEKIVIVFLTCDSLNTNKLLEYPYHAIENGYPEEKINFCDYKNLKVYQINFDFFLFKLLYRLKDRKGVKGMLPSITKLTEEERNSFKPYKFFSLMGSGNLHRLKFYKCLEEFDLLKDGLVSAWWLERYLDIVNEDGVRYSSFDPNYINEETWNECGESTYQVHYSEKIYKNCYFQIITETEINYYQRLHYEENNVIQRKRRPFIIGTEYKHKDFVFLTEKTFRALCSNPFILYSSKHSLKALHDYGFKTFDGIIDESYDEISDIYEKIEFLNNLVVELLSRDRKELRRMYIESIPILEHNWNILNNMSSQKMILDLQNLLFKIK